MTERKIKSSFVDLLLLIFINHNHLQLKNLWTPVLLRYYSLNFLLFFPISCISKAVVNKTWTQPWWNVISIHYLGLKSYLTYYTKKCIFFIVWRYSVSILSLEEEQGILNIFSALRFSLNLDLNPITTVSLGNMAHGLKSWEILSCN